jgi:hypothetical protein
MDVTGISEENKHLSLPSKYGYWLAIGYFGVVKDRGGRALRVFWMGSVVMVCYSLFWTPLREVVFGLFGQLVGETAARISPWGYADARHMSRK